MIVVNLTNLRNQVVLTPHMEKAVTFLEQADFTDLPDGRIEIDGDNAFALVQSYDTVAGADILFEGHRKYIDIQYVAAGDEFIGWADINDTTVTKPYSDDNEVWFGTVPALKATMVRLTTGQLAVLYPIDAHAPRCAVGPGSHVKKIVVKVAV